jgi:hypothetical protein
MESSGGLIAYVVSKKGSYHLNSQVPRPSGEVFGSCRCGVKSGVTLEQLPTLLEVEKDCPRSSNNSCTAWSICGLFFIGQFYLGRLAAGWSASATPNDYGNSKEESFGFSECGEIRENDWETLSHIPFFKGSAGAKN